MRLAWIATMTAQKVTPICGTTEKQAQRIIANATAAGLHMGLSQAELGKMIQSDIRTQGGALARARARVIARTESHAASNAAQQQAAVATGLPMLKEWVAANQPDRTRQDHQDADGQTVELHMPFIVGGEELMQPGDPNGSAENVINCFSGDTLLSCDSIKSSIKSTYSGEIITIETASGYKLTGTPNHPVMTSSGFIRLDQVDHFTDLLCCPLSVNLTGAFNVVNIPSTFEQVHDALSVVGMRMRVGTVGVNLYGRSPDGNVDIVGAAGLLRDDGKTELFKLANKKRFHIARLGKRSLFSNGLQYGRAGMKLWRLFSDRLMRSLDLCRSLFVSHLRPFKFFSLRAASNVNIGFNQISANDVARNAERFGNFQLRHAGQVLINNNASRQSYSGVSDRGAHGFKLSENKGFADAELFRNFSHVKSGFIHSDNVARIDRKFVHNHPVYTIETNEGIYNAGGIIARNCRCASVFVVQD
jgi:hypothetical protein